MLACHIETPPSGVFIFVLVVLAALAVSVRATQKAEIEELQNRLDSSKAEADGAARNAEANASEFSNLNSRFTGLQNDHKQLRTTHKTVQDEHQALVAQLESDHNQLQMKYMTGQDNLEALRIERGELKHRLETQAAELAAASANEITFMTQRVAASSIIGMMQELNTVIYRNTMRLISVIRANAKGTFDDEPLRANTRVHAIEAIGERLLNLATTSNKDDHTMLAVALQSSLVHACLLAISGMTSGVHKSDVVYRQMWLNDKQAVVSRSRAPTNQRSSDLSDENAVIEVVLTTLTSVLLSIGSNEEPQHIRSRIRKESENLDRIATLVAKISKIIREEIKSDILQVMYVHPGETFDASLMRTEGEGALPVISGIPVLSTVALGLALRIRSGGQKPLLGPLVVLDSHASSR